VGVALLCCTGLRLPQLRVRQLSHAFLFFKTHCGTSETKTLKMNKSLFSVIAVGLCMTAHVFLPGQVMAQVPNYVPTNGLVGYWPFNGNANDESGNGNNGTVNGATLTTDRFGVANKAYSFDGVNDVISMNGQNYANITLSAWIKTNSAQINGDIINKYGCTTANGYSLRLNSGKPSGYFGCIFNGFIDFDTQTPQLPAANNNQWRHVVMTVSNIESKLYLDGVLLSTIINQPGFCTPTNSLPLQIGYYPIGNCPSGMPNNYTQGLIDEVGIWNRPLSYCEIQGLYNSQLSTVSGISASISAQPTAIGSSAILSTTSQLQNIQWQNNPLNNGWQNVPSNSNYSGGTSNTLTVSNVQLSNHNQPFRVIANTGNCADTSNTVTIQIADTCITTVYDTLLTTVTDTLIINTTLSLPAPNNANTILIYPNPASDHITIDNGNYTAMAGYTIKIENNAGQQVFQSLINQAQFYVDLSTWTGNGLYFVHLIDAQGNTVTVRKIVLQ
jgi:hypothetical protein